MRKDQGAEEEVAQAIMTTDLIEKHALVRGDGFSVGGICKGSGMIAPNMGTMIALLYTDAEITAGGLRQALRLAARRSFNRVVVDGDTSTNDIAICTATGKAGRVPQAAFRSALEECARSLAIQIARDGEGATNSSRWWSGVPGPRRGPPTLQGPWSDRRSSRPRSMARIPTGDGYRRGRTGRVEFDPDQVSLSIGAGDERTPLLDRGEIVADLARAKQAMKGREVRFELDLGQGQGEATAWGCDLTEKVRGDQREVYDVKREEVLMEALPYIQRFHGKTIVIKLGGHAMVDQEILEMAIRDAVLLQYVGMKVVIVHGGGPEITEKMQAMGKEPKFVGGLRITDLETLEIAQMVLVGKINDGIVSLIARGGARGVGLSGNDGNLVIARKMDPQKVKEGGRVKEVDLGYVGEIETVDPAVLLTLLDKGYIPVIAPIAIDREGTSLNINADTAAGEIAVALRAFKLVNLTDVDGVMDAGRTQIYRRLTTVEMERLIADGTVSGGMIPKITSSLNAVKNGVEQAHIINGNRGHNLLLELFTNAGVGTMISR